MSEDFNNLKEGDRAWYETSEEGKLIKRIGTVVSLEIFEGDASAHVQFDDVSWKEWHLACNLNKITE